jgi:hypothetical protein
MRKLIEEQPPKGRSLSDKRSMDKAWATLRKCLPPHAHVIDGEEPKSTPKIIKELIEENNRLRKEKRMLALQIFSEKLRGKHDPIKGTVNTVKFAQGYYYEVLMGDCEIRGACISQHRKTALRAARRIVERINRKGVEIC